MSDDQWDDPPPKRRMNGERRDLTIEEQASVRALASLTHQGVRAWLDKIGLGRRATLMFREPWEYGLAEQAFDPSTVDIDSSGVPPEVWPMFEAVWSWSVGRLREHGERWGITQLRWLAKWRVPEIIEQESRWARARDHGTSARVYVRAVRPWLDLMHSEWL